MKLTLTALILSAMALLAEPEVQTTLSGTVSSEEFYKHRLKSNPELWNRTTQYSEPWMLIHHGQGKDQYAPEAMWIEVKRKPVVTEKDGMWYITFPKP